MNILIKFKTKWLSEEFDMKSNSLCEFILSDACKNVLAIFFLLIFNYFLIIAV